LNFHQEERLVSKRKKYNDLSLCISRTPKDFLRFLDLIHTRLIYEIFFPSLKLSRAVLRHYHAENGGRRASATHGYSNHFHRCISECNKVGYFKFVLPLSANTLNLGGNVIGISS
jgi:hypothetical protein